MKKNFEIAVSILSMDFLNLKKIIDNIISLKKITRLHYDVMDYDFVENLSFGPHILKTISKYTNKKLKIDCHMMTRIKHLSVEKYLKPFIEAKVDIITFHYEALTNKQLDEFLKIKTKYKQKIGLAIKPNTKLSNVLNLISQVDLILIMSVEPGFGGQHFIKNTENKLNEVKKFIEKNNLKTLIQVDGGINNNTYKLCTSADILVMGSYLANAKDKLDLANRVNSLYEDQS